MAWLCVAIAVAATACSPGDGEGARYIGRVVSVTSSQVCVGPSSSSSHVTCASAPDGFSPLPKVGQCVGLFPARISNGHVASWSAASLRLQYQDRDCQGHG
jgi:hypothetical protein